MCTQPQRGASFGAAGRKAGEAPSAKSMRGAGGTATARGEGGGRGGAAAGAGRGRAAHSSPSAESCPSSEGIDPLSELARSSLQQRCGAASDTRARASTRPALAAAHSLAHGLRNRHAVSHLAPSRYTPTPMPHPLDMHIDMYVYTYMCRCA